jgi:hypothetical protein
MKAGVIDYYFQFLCSLIPTLLAESVRHGNKYLHTKRFSMHVMEKGIESFDYVAVTLWLERFECVSSTDQERMFSGVFHIGNLSSA